MPPASQLTSQHTGPHRCSTSSYQRTTAPLGDRTCEQSPAQSPAISGHAHHTCLEKSVHTTKHKPATSIGRQVSRLLLASEAAKPRGCSVIQCCCQCCRRCISPRLRTSPEAELTPCCVRPHTAPLQHPLSCTQTQSGDAAGCCCSALLVSPAAAQFVCGCANMLLHCTAHAAGPAITAVMLLLLSFTPGRGTKMLWCVPTCAQC